MNGPGCNVHQVLLSVDFQAQSGVRWIHIRGVLSLIEQAG